jgi:hypothetical protein
LRKRTGRGDQHQKDSACVSHYGLPPGAVSFRGK